MMLMGSTISVCCRADGQPLSHTIKIQGNGILEFVEVTGEEQGEYICTGSNSAGSSQARTSLHIRGNNNSSLSFPPDVLSAQSAYALSLHLSLFISLALSLSLSLSLSLFISLALRVHVGIIQCL